MTDDQIEAEVARVAAVARKFFADVAQRSEGDDVTDLHVETFVVGAIFAARDEDGDPMHKVEARFESKSVVIQAGVLAALAAIDPFDPACRP